VAPLRQKLIHVLASIVAIDLAIAGVVIDARSGSASPSSPVALKSPTTANGHVLPAGYLGGILGAGTFKHRRGPGGTTVTTAASGSSEVASGLPAASPSSSATTGAPASSGSTGTTRSRSTGGSGSTGGASNGQTGRTAPPSTAGGPTGAPAGATSDPGASGGDGGAVFDPGPGSDPTVDPSTPSGTTGTTATTAPPVHNPPAKGPASLVLADKTGDTTADGSGAAMAQPQADIVKAQANWTAKALVFAVQVAQPVNPAQDAHWASASTYIQWDLDTNGDGTPDFAVQYYFDPKGGLVADVSKAGDTSGQSACGGEAGYTADGYTVAIDPACLGNPASVMFRATTYYDPDPANANGNLATDVTPDGGLSGPVSKP
jgi:hypothetical protein